MGISFLHALIQGDDLLALPRSSANRIDADLVSQVNKVDVSVKWGRGDRTAS